MKCDKKKVLLFLIVVAGVLFAAVFSFAASKIGTVEQSTELTKVSVESGELAGYVLNGTYTFKGIPYAEADRFMMPRKVKPWTGSRTALKYGEVCPTGSNAANPAEFMTPTGTDQVENEKCHYLNVWTRSLDNKAKKPVIVWLHGGGFFSGSSHELIYYDGANLSASGDVVFVSVNHRLNVLGFMDLSAYGEAYKYSGNVGMADIAAALQWVRDNIENFGGDPGNVTVEGQSGGGGKVLTLMGLPAAKGLFHKAVVQSGGVRGRNQETARKSAAKVLEILGIAGDQVSKLKDVPYDALNDAANKAGFRAGPVIDGDYYPEDTVADGKFSDISQNVPLMIGATFGEFQSNFGTLMMSGQTGDCHRPSVTTARVRELLKEKYGDDADAVEGAFKKAYPTHDLFDALYITVRNSAVATAKANQQGAAVYQFLFAWNFPIFGGVTSWHTGGDVPFFFNNVDKIGYMVAGNESEAETLEKEAFIALVNFAYHGDPNGKGVANWPKFNGQDGYTMIFDKMSEAKGHHDADLMTLISGKIKNPFF